VKAGQQVPKCCSGPRVGRIAWNALSNEKWLRDLEYCASLQVRFFENSIKRITELRYNLDVIRKHHLRDTGIYLSNIKMDFEE
jgi:hypothetical protein